MTKKVTIYLGGAALVMELTKTSVTDLLNQWRQVNDELGQLRFEDYLVSSETETCVLNLLRVDGIRVE